MADTGKHHSAGKKKKQDMRIAMQRVTDINTLHLYTPQYLATTQSLDSVDAFLAKSYMTEQNADNYLSQLQAIIRQDIYKSSGRMIADMKNLIKCNVLVVVTTQDLLVNPLNAIEFAKANNFKLVELSSDFGHLLPFFKANEIKQVTIKFLK